MIKLHSTKKRSLRLQKKLHVGYYKSYFAQFRVTYDTPNDVEFQRDDDIAETLSWFGGYCFSNSDNNIFDGGLDWYARYGDDIQHEIAVKLSKLPGVSDVVVSAPVDAWYFDGFANDDYDLFELNGSISIP